MTGIELESGIILGGDFRILRPLRVGGMGAVYVAEQQSTGAMRAIKVMQRELVSDPVLRERFEQEARVGATIDSDHVVQVIGAGVDGAHGIPWIAMELLEGLPLDLYLAQKGRRPPGEVRFLFEQFCHALSLAHARGIVHRDLKPANVFLCASRVVGLSYVVKVLDFGIAKVLAEAKTARTAAVGTPLYMAPEQYDAGKVTPATDVWAIGLIAFELLTGRSYWKSAGSDATPAKIMYETCIGEIVPASGRATDLGLERLPEGFDAWFAKCLERKPEDRFVDAGAAFFMLKEVLGPSAPPTEPLASIRVRDLVPTREAGVAPMPARALAPVMPKSPTQSMSFEPTSATPVESKMKAQTELVTAPRAAVPATELSPPARNNGKLMAVGALVGALFIGFVGVRMLRGPAVVEPAPQASVVHAASAASSAPFATASTPNHFTETGTVNVDGRTLHTKIPPGVRTETYVMLDLQGEDRAPTTVAPMHLALVIDRSGSMKGGRLDNAISAAKAAIERLRDGDQVTVIAFDQTSQMVVAPTKLDPKTRAEVVASVNKLTLGGDTCVSCGLSMALDKLGSGTEWTRRIILLSDGEANVGIKDLPGFEKLARDAQKADVSITTIGVGHDYDPKALTAIARESNGRHYYVESDAGLPAVFDAEAKAMVVASSTEAIVRLAPGVQLVKVLDRAHRVEGNTVHVPLGQLTRNEHKTVLIKVAVTGTEGLDRAPIGDIDIQFKDLLESGPRQIHGELAIAVGPGFEPTDSIVETRVQRSETAAALLEANELFAKGQAKAAAAVLSKQGKVLADQKKKIAAKPEAANPYVAKDIDSQAKAVSEAEKGYATAPPAPAPPTGGAAGPAPATQAAPPPAPAPKKAAAKAANDAFNMAY